MGAAHQASPAAFVRPGTPPRWPLRRIEDLDVEQSVIESAGLPGPEGPPHTLYSPGVDVEVAWFDKVLDEEAP